MCLFYATSVVAVSYLLNISLSDLITCFHICWGWGRGGNLNITVTSFLFVLVLHCSLLEIQLALPVQGAAASGAALPIPISVCSSYAGPNNGKAAGAQYF